jgi:hypothetical protein
VRAGRGRLAVTAAAVVALAAATAAVGLGPDGPAVVVADQRGREVASVALGTPGRFALQYRHSVYRAEVTETFAVDGGTGFRLVEVASPSEAVLDYYELEGRRRADGGWLRLEPDAPPRLDSLPLVATELGRRTLVAGGRRLPLYAGGQGPVRLVLSVRGRPGLASRVPGPGSGRCR